MSQIVWLERNITRAIWKYQISPKENLVPAGNCVLQWFYYMSLMTSDIEHISVVLLEQCRFFGETST
jgi:hypothetical protein